MFHFIVCAYDLFVFRLDEAVSRLSELSVARPKVSGNTKMSGLKMDGDAELVER